MLRNKFCQRKSSLLSPSFSVSSEYVFVPRSLPSRAVMSSDYFDFSTNEMRSKFSEYFEAICIVSIEGIGATKG